MRAEPLVPRFGGCSGIAVPEEVARRDGLCEGYEPLVPLEGEEESVRACIGRVDAHVARFRCCKHEEPFKASFRKATVVRLGGGNQMAYVGEVTCRAGCSFKYDGAVLDGDGRALPGQGWFYDGKSFTVFSEAFLNAALASIKSFKQGTLREVYEQLRATCDGGVARDRKTTMGAVLSWLHRAKDSMSCECCAICGQFPVALLCDGTAISVRSFPFFAPLPYCRGPLPLCHRRPRLRLCLRLRRLCPLCRLSESSSMT